MTDLAPYLISGLATAIAGIIAGRFSMAKSHLEATTAPYAALAARVTVAEEELMNQAEENRARREENEEIRRENALIRRRMKQLSAEYAEAREEARADRAYIAKAAPWIAAHAHYATYRPPVPPPWYQAPPAARPTTRPREARGENTTDDEEEDP